MPCKISPTLLMSFNYTDWGGENYCAQSTVQNSPFEMEACSSSAPSRDFVGPWFSVAVRKGEKPLAERHTLCAGTERVSLALH